VEVEAARAVSSQHTAQSAHSVLHGWNKVRLGVERKRGRTLGGDDAWDWARALTMFWHVSIGTGARPSPVQSAVVYIFIIGTPSMHSWFSKPPVTGTQRVSSVMDDTGICEEVLVPSAQELALWWVIIRISPTQEMDAKESAHTHTRLPGQ
jgi:hypothetical protein